MMPRYRAVAIELRLGWITCVVLWSLCRIFVQRIGHRDKSADQVKGSTCLFKGLVDIATKWKTVEIVHFARNGEVHWIQSYLRTVLIFGQRAFERLATKFIACTKCLQTSAPEKVPIVQLLVWSLKALPKPVWYRQIEDSGMLGYLAALYSRRDSHNLRVDLKTVRYVCRIHYMP